MGWVNPWVGLGPNFSVCNGLGWVGSTVQAMKIGVFYSHVIGVLIIILFLLKFETNTTTHVTLSIHSPSCVTVHPLPTLRTTPIGSSPTETSWPPTTL